MKIIIVGAGRIGRNLAHTLSEEDHEVYLVENNEEKARKAAEKLDAKLVIGSGADPDTLAKAQVDQADLVLAVTTTDETNLVVCSLAEFFGAKRRIARVRNSSLSDLLREQGHRQFKINEFINPEILAAEDIVKTVGAPGASEVADFANGRMLLRGFDISKSSPLFGMRMQDFNDEDFPWPFLIVSIIRNDTVLIPEGDTVIEEEDHIYVLLPAQSLAEFLTFVNPDIKMPKKVLVYGATITGQEVAKALATTVKDIILIEENADKAKDVAGELQSVRVIHGSAAEADILTECGVEAADAFVAASNNDHSNLISSVLAKEMGAKTTIIITQHPEYMSIGDTLDIDAIINPQHLAVEQILHLVRGRGISSAKLLECDTEAIEFVTEENAPVTKSTLKEIKFPKNTIVGAVYSNSEIHLATGDTQIEPGQKVIVFCQETSIKKLQEMFTGK